jgi:hypothetical protein
MDVEYDDAAAVGPFTTDLPVVASREGKIVTQPPRDDRREHANDKATPVVAGSGARPEGKTAEGK